MDADKNGASSGGGGGDGGGGSDGGNDPLTLDGDHALRWPDLARVPLFLAVGDGAAGKLVHIPLCGVYRVYMTFSFSLIARCVVINLF